ncbi:hypothetical protein HNQ93_001430 [Hymenobacter luteus]|uniref:DUF3592 domain-containing protein n=2 Tax=Hymenobacter TaxID=89966 RepID=A0A7W9WAB3_9BACT|nr:MULTISPECIES: hypothetical protein [Hymenobacter]MBB4601209.1 hypothetical protein [Hymenobacter latericoloratus]MBB6058584.1 hypothetical protein [Hymenobacter luteus]
MESWRTVYDFADRLPNFGVMAIPLLLAAGGFGLYQHHKASTDETLMPVFGITKRRYQMLMGRILMGFAGLIALIVIPSQLLEYTRTRQAYTQRQYQTVEGAVADFDPMPYGGHRHETFTVAGVPFAFSDYDETDYGYNHTASHGGAIRAGLRVRIAYLPTERKNVILKLDTLAARPPDGR